MSIWAIYLGRSYSIFSLLLRPPLGDRLEFEKEPAFPERAQHLVKYCTV